MPRPRKLFRHENASKDSGLSFHCCGKPDDLVDEPLDFINERRRKRKKTGPSHSGARTDERQLDSLLVSTLCNQGRFGKGSRNSEVLSPGSSRASSSTWSIHSFLFSSTPSIPNSKSNSRIKRFWSKKQVEPSIGANQEVVISATSGGSTEHKSLRSARSMPLLSIPSSAITRRKRCRSRLSPWPFSGSDYPAENQDKNEGSDSLRRDFADLTAPEAHHTTHTTHNDHANVASLKPPPGVSSKSFKIPGFLSMTNWISFFFNRHEEEKNFSQHIP